MNNLLTNDYERLLSGDGQLKNKLAMLMESIVSAANVAEGTGAPTMTAVKHSWYFDTTSSKYYRNTNGGTTWVALN